MQEGHVKACADPRSRGLRTWRVGFLLLVRCSWGLFGGSGRSSRSKVVRKGRSCKRWRHTPECSAPRLVRQCWSFAPNMWHWLELRPQVLRLETNVEAPDHVVAAHFLQRLRLMAKRGAAAFRERLAARKASISTSSRFHMATRRQSCQRCVAPGCPYSVRCGGWHHRSNGARKPPRERLRKEPNPRQMDL